MFTATKELILPTTVTGSFPRPRWYDVSMAGRPLDACMLDVRFREKFQDALAVVVSDQERAGLDIVGHGDFHLDEDLAGCCWLAYPLQRWKGFEGDYQQREEETAPWRHYAPGTLLHEIYSGWRWPHVVDKVEHRPLGYPKIWRIAQAKTRKPLKFGTCCSAASALFLDIHTPKYKDRRQLIWDMAEAMNKELLALRAAGCRCIQTEEPSFHFMANSYGKDHDDVKFMIEAFNREMAGLDDVEVWIHTCWGNPNMQRIREDTSYANSIEIYLERCRGDVWTLEMKDRNQQDLELFEPFKHDLKKKIAIGVVSHRTLQADRPEDVAGEIRKTLKVIPPERLIASSDCGFGRQGANREIAFYKASAIAQGANIVRRELGLPQTLVPAADPALQVDTIPGRGAARTGGNQD
ncbi:MAG TPA: cobalamin-independent methionine synthase II family protein [Terriglobia bacterium]|nr:cobalamin-independent methionine synthase II family protein [Terriglobia bacterium]